jgi:hypothetical protein
MVPAYVRSLLKTTYILTKEGINWNYMTEYSSHVADARERTLGGTGFNNKNQRRPGDGMFTYGKIFWIDSDIEWEPEDFFRLLKSDKQVISGVYQMESEEVPVYPVPLGQPLHKNDILKMKSPFTVRGVGFGFLAVASGVFERMERPWFSSTHVAVTNSETGEVEYKFPLMGEDTSWCEKAYQMGVDIWVDPLVRVGHQKTVRLRW